MDVSMTTSNAHSWISYYYSYKKSLYYVRRSPLKKSYFGLCQNNSVGISIRMGILQSFSCTPTSKLSKGHCCNNVSEVQILVLSCQSNELGHSSANIVYNRFNYIPTQYLKKYGKLKTKSIYIIHKYLTQSIDFAFNLYYIIKSDGKIQFRHYYALHNCIQ